MSTPARPVARAISESLKMINRSQSLLLIATLAVSLVTGACQTEPAKQGTGNKASAPSGARSNPPGSVEERENTTLYAVKMVDAKTAFAYGTNDVGFTGSVVIRTTDGGASWNCVLRTEQTELVGLDFIDAKNGAAISDGGVVYSTSDGGDSWMASNDIDLFTAKYTIETKPIAPVRPQPAPANRNSPAQPAQVVAADYVELLGLTFKTEKDGWAFGSREESTQGSKPGSIVTKTRPVVVRTSDGGATWQPVTLASDLPSLGMSRSSFVDAMNGWVVAGTIDEDDTGAVLRTTDGGTTWKTVPMPDSKQVPQSIFFLDANNGWLVGATEDEAGDAGPSQILATKDGGATWEVKTKVAASLRSVHFIDAQTGMAVGSGGKIFRTADGGATWTEATTHDWTTGTVVETTDPLYKAGQPQPTYTAFVLVAPGRGFATSDLGVHAYRAK